MSRSQDRSFQAEAIRKTDWTKHPLGEYKSWPQELKTALSLMLNSHFPMFLTWGPERYFFYNDAYIPVLGAQKHANALGAKFENLWSDIWSDLEPIVKKVDEGEASYFTDLPLLMDRNGKFEQTYFTFSYSPIYDAAGNVAGLFCACVETTETILARERLIASAEKIRESAREAEINAENLTSFFMQSPLPMVILEGADHRFTLANPPYERFVGQKVIGKRVRDVFPEDQLVVFNPLLDSVFTTGVPVIGREMPLNFPNEHGIVENHFVDIGYHPFRAADGSIKGVLAIVQDMTEHVAARNRADQEKSKLIAAFEAVADGIFIFDSNGKPVFMNRGAAIVFGSNESSDVFKDFEFFFERLDLYEMDGTFVELENWPVARALRGESFRDWQLQAHRKDIDKRWIWSSSGELARQPGSDVTLAVVVLRDITEQKNAEIDLENAKDEAERANALKSAFLANMSHEIRTPLGAMMGFADLLRDQTLSNTDRSSYTDILVRNGEQLSVIINDILDLSKVEAGHLTLEYTDVEPARILNEAVALLQVTAKEKGLTLESSIDDSVHAPMVSDPTRIRQVLLNLISNSIKFTPTGSVKLRAFADTDEKGARRLNFEITDTGIGISPSHHQKIFEVFVQADGSMTRRFGGTGLGLALSRSLARALGGDVTVVDSEEGRGSRFLFQVADRPQMRGSIREPEAQVPEIELTNDVLQGKSVLVVDDAPDNQQLIRRYLTSRGATVDSAENGLVGYRKALASNYDIVLMDIQMPEMDGYTATQKLRAAGYRQPIVALTAHAMDDVKRKCLNVGCTDHLTKPIVAKSLIATVARLTSR